MKFSNLADKHILLREKYYVNSNIIARTLCVLCNVATFFSFSITLILPGSKTLEIKHLFLASWLFVSVLILNREHKSSLVFSYGNYDKTIVLRQKLFKHGENMQQCLPLKHRADVLLQKTVLVLGQGPSSLIWISFMNNISLRYISSVHINIQDITSEKLIV